MIIQKFSVTGQSIDRANYLDLVADSRNFIGFQFTFSPEWQGVNKTAVITTGGAAYRCLIGGDGVLLPGDMPVLRAGTCTVSVFGGDLYTAGECTLAVGQSGLKDGAAPPPPPPEVYAQILKRASDAEAHAVNAENLANDTQNRAAQEAVKSGDSAAAAAVSAASAADTVSGFDAHAAAKKTLVADEGTKQLRLVTTEGTAQTAAAKAEAKQAQDARTGAQTAQTAAAGSASNAQSSASTAAGSATSAQSSANAAAGSASAAAGAVQTHNNAPAAHSTLFDGVKTWALGVFATLIHKHGAGDITSGVLPVAYGGTGGSNAGAARAGIGACARYRLTATIPTTGWTAATVGVVQTLNVMGATADMAPVVDVVQANDAATAALQLEAWGCISRIVTGAGNVTVYCYGGAPQTAVPVQLAGVM